MPASDNKTFNILVSNLNGFWNQGSYTQEDKPHTTVKYNGKNLDNNSPPNRVIFYSNKNRLGEGGFGTVYEGGAYTINYETRTITYKKDKVVKVIPKVDARTEKSILSEYAQGKKAPHLGMKKPEFSGSLGNKTCYIVMSRLPGKELFELINDGHINNLPVKKKLELTYKLLLALRDQVTDLGIVHRDLKPENIMVQLEPEINVSIIDYGLAKEQNTDDQLFPGSAPYAAPEIHQHQSHDSLCDVFSMAKVIALLWTNDNYLAEVVDPKNLVNCVLYAADPIRRCQSPDLNSNPKILTLLKRMLVAEKNQRITIDDAIEYFERFYPHTGNTGIALDKGKLIENKNNERGAPQLDENEQQRIAEHLANILTHLANLESYADEISRTHQDYSRTIKDFTQGMTAIINDDKISIQDIKDQCLAKLSEPAIIECAKKHKQVSYVLKNILAAIVGLCVIYGFACGINYLATGRATFFHNKICNARHDITKDCNKLVLEDKKGGCFPSFF